MLAAGLEAEVVGDETFTLLAEKFLDDGVAAADDEEFAGIVKFRADITAIGGKLGEGGEDVELGDCSSCTAKTRGFAGDAGAQIDEELAFDFEDALVSSENFPLVIL